eukprot:s1832_g3.t2
MAFSPLPRLVHGEAVRSFLLGRWAVSKTFDYRKGGSRGVLEGYATFSDIPEKKGALMYEERGDMQLEGFPRPFEAYRFYCFNTSCWPELNVHTSFFVPLAFEGAGPIGLNRRLAGKRGNVPTPLCRRPLQWTVAREFGRQFRVELVRSGAEQGRRDQGHLPARLLKCEALSAQSSAADGRAEQSRKQLLQDEAASSARRPARRRGLDRTWQDERELDFERRVAPDSRGEAGRQSPESQKSTVVVAVAAELRSYAQLGELPGPPLPTPGVSDGRAAQLLPSSLRRLKHVEADVACGIERECGLDISQGVDVFRLVLPNAQSSIRTTTRVLLVQTGEAFLCEEPISEDAAEPVAPGAYVAEAKEVPGPSWLAVTLNYFRAVPKRSPLSSKVGRVPALHVTVTFDDGTEQAMEFIGIHQRRYYVEDPASDALAQHLTESLLRVALEYIFHPSRSRFAKERVVLRECSLDKEALHSREELLPRMVEGIRKCNDKIKDVELEMGGPRPLANAARKAKSFLALDEDVLKVAPAKEQVKSAPPAGSAFRGLKTGFLNSGKAKQRGLAEKAPEAAASSSAPSSSSTQVPCPERAVLDETVRPCVETTAEEKRQLLLPAAEPAPNELRAREVAFALRATPDVQEEEPDSPEDAGGPASLTELANQLFGVAELEEASQRTESTEIPSPLAAGASTALSEHSEALEAPAPSSGLRLLQQRRRERAEAAPRAAGSAEAANDGENTAGNRSRAAETTDELVALWMKQRW